MDGGRCREDCRLSVAQAAAAGRVRDNGMKKQKFRFLAILLSCIMLLLSAEPALATSVSDLEKQKKELEQQKKEADAKKKQEQQKRAGA